MTAPLRIGIAGLGVVGSSVVKFLQENADAMAARSERRLEIVAVSARKREAKRGVDLSGYAWEDNPLALVQRDDLDIVVELIGGEDGVAKDLVETALQAGKQVVTANKALLARHGGDLARLAEAQHVNLFFEAAVGGAMPCVELLRDGMIAGRAHGLRAVLNGTSNYILTCMERGAEYAEALAQARTEGYAEADSALDVGGWDSAHKLAILSTLCFGELPDLSSIHVEGIEGLTPEDFAVADELGYRIRLLGVATLLEDRRVFRAVYPCLLPRSTGLARIYGARNAVEVLDDWAEKVLIEGTGAGGHATATAVASDLVQIARGGVSAPFGIPSRLLRKASAVAMESRYGAYYLRFRVTDKPGTLASLTGAFGRHGLSVSSVRQRRRERQDDEVPLYVTIHDTDEATVLQALAEIEKESFCTAAPMLLRIETQ